MWKEIKFDWRLLYLEEKGKSSCECSHLILQR